LTAVTIGELFIGAHMLPEGKRRENLLLAVQRIAIGYEERILPYDAVAAQVYAQLQEQSKRTGKQLTVEDGMIAAICIATQTTLATRNTKDFRHTSVLLINPFEVSI